jgi:DNA-binding SARP family transcriptional activator
VLAPMQVQAGVAPVEIGARKARALLAYLALRPGVAVPRETLAGLLWADRGDEHRRAYRAVSCRPQRAKADQQPVRL